MDNTNLQKPQPMVTFGDPNEKEYLVLMIGYDDEGNEMRDFEWVTGRQEAYDFIKGLVLTEQFDLFQSKIIVEGTAIETAKTLIEFMKYVIEAGLITDPGFDIMDYVTGDQEEE